MLHFAGGNSYSFQFMASSLTDFEVITLELPGRGKRVNEELVTDFELAARDIYYQIGQRLNTPVFLIYGHSMGAYLALRVSFMLQQAGTPPAYLIVSGNAGPGVKEKKKIYLLERKHFIEELISLGGIPSEAISNEELFDFFEPILRADFEVAENNGISDEQIVDSPLYALMGSLEEKVNEISNWGRFTRSDFTAEVLEGDHFFIYKNAQRIASIIKTCYLKKIK
jgi:surfactin synthase thioesterase subunit